MLERNIPLCFHSVLTFLAARLYLAKFDLWQWDWIGYSRTYNQSLRTLIEFIYFSPSYLRPYRRNVRTMKTPFNNSSTLNWSPAVFMNSNKHLVTSFFSTFAAIALSWRPEPGGFNLSYPLEPNNRVGHFQYVSLSWIVLRIESTVSLILEENSVGTFAFSVRTSCITST